MSQPKARRALACAVGVLALALAVGAPRAGADVAGTQYRLHFSGGGTEDVTDQAITQEELNSHQTADWTLEPADVNVWLPRYDTPPDQAQAGVTEYHAPDSRQTQGNADPTIGQVKETGTYSWQEDNATHTESYSCSGPVGYSGDYVHRVVVTQGDPTVDLETDLSVLDVAGAPDESSFGPCATDTYHGPSVAEFLYAFDQPPGQRLQLGMLIPAQEIGDAFIGGPAQDYNNVQASHSSLACYFDGTCNVSFTLTGDYSLQKICDGVISSNGTASCATGSTSPPPSDNPSPNSNQQTVPSSSKPSTSPSSPKTKPTSPPAPSKPVLSPRSPLPCTGQQRVVTATECGSTVSTGGLASGGRIVIEVQRVIDCRRRVRHPKPRRGASCPRYVTLVRTTQQISASTISFHFTGDLHGRRLPGGQYRIVVWQVHGHARSPARTVTFRLR